MIEQTISSRNDLSKLELFAYLIFIMSNILMLINPGVFWDDWTIYNMNNKGLMNQYYGNGNLMFGYLHLGLKQLSGSTWLYHSLTFCCQFLNVFLLLKIIQKSQIKDSFRLFLSFVVLVFAAFPVHDAKATIIIFPHVLCLTLFITGSFFLLQYSLRNNLAFRILSLCFFLFSFLINSLLVFYLLPILFFLFGDLGKIIITKKVGSVKKFLKRTFFRMLNYIDFLLLPIVFWVIKLNYFKPSMQYKSIGYNNVKLETLLDIPYRIVVFLYVFIVDLVPLVLEAISYFELWLFLGIAAIFIYKYASKIKLDFTISWGFLLLGFLILILGAFPYLMVNKYPSYLDYHSRHQLLVGIGAALSFSSVVFLIRSELAKRLILTISISGFMAITIFLHFSYFKGYVKQQVFQSYFFSNSHFLSENSETILLEDYTEDFTQKGNPTKFYAFAGMLKTRYPNENILIVRSEDLQYYMEDDILEKISPYYFQYSLTNYEFANPELLLEVKYGEKRPVFPIWTYYKDLLAGNKKDWNRYFKFNLKPIEFGEFEWQ